MVAAVSTAPSPVSSPVNALGGKADAAADGVALDAGPGGSGNIFASLLQKHMGRSTAQPASNAAEAILLPGAGDDGQATTESETVAADLAALLPFLEAAGLAVKGEAADEADAEAPSLAEDDPALALAAAASLTPPATPAAPAASAAAPSANTAGQAGTAVPSANIAATEADAADAKAAGLPQPAAAESGRPAAASFADQLAAAQANVPGQTQAVQDKPDGEASSQSPQPALQPSGQAAAGAVHAAERGATPPTLAVPSPVGSPRWHQELGDHVVWMASRLENRAELVLNPPQMGRIEVSLSVSGDQASAIFTSANPTVRDALEASLPRLREVLADAGIQLGQAQVGAENARQSAQQEKNGDNFTAGRDAAPADAATSRSPTGDAREPVVLKAGRGLVDTFA